jgi:hypothetical protein
MLDATTIKRHLIAFEPEAVLPSLASDIGAVYVNRAFIRMAPCTDYVIGHLARVILAATEQGKRFRKYECLRNIRQIIRGHPCLSALSSETVELLFRLYQHYIYSDKEEIQWCVSTYLKDRMLAVHQVLWLTENAASSVHLLNRLLRYPVRDAAIARWAQASLAADQFSDRKAELLALLIEDELPACAAGVPAETVLWAIYYARLPVEEKSRLLRSIMTKEAAESALTIAMRLGLPEVVRGLTELFGEGDAK